MKLSAMQKGIAVALVHTLLVCSLGAKLMIDRATRPRIWVKSVPYDPDMPIRGRYVNMQLVVETRGMHASKKEYDTSHWANLVVENGKLIAVANEDYTGELVYL